MGQGILYNDITGAGGDIFYSEYQDVLFQRNLLAGFVISLASLCIYLIFTRSSVVRDKPEKGFVNLFAEDFMKNLRASSDEGMKREGDSKEGGSKEKSSKEEDSDDDDDDVDSFMKNIRKMTAPKNEVSRSQQQLSSNVQVEAFGTDINSMMDKIRIVAVGNQITPEKAELVDSMFGLMEGMGKNFMNQFEQAAGVLTSDADDCEQEVGAPISDFSDIKGFGTLAAELQSLDTVKSNASEQDTSEQDTPEQDTSEQDTPEQDTPEQDTSEHDTSEQDNES
jgi:hypothetical protein